MKKTTIITLAILTVALICSAKEEVLTWSWNADGSPYTVTSDGAQAFFNDKNGAVWKFQDLASGQNDAAKWTTLIKSGTYFHSDAPTWDVWSAEVDSAVLLSAPSSGHSAALLFIAPVAGKYTISGRLWIGPVTEDDQADTQLIVGKVENDKFTPLVTATGPRWSLGRELSSFPELNDISLKAGDAIAFVLPYQNAGQRMYLQDHSGSQTNNPEVENNPLTITVTKP